MSSQLSSTLQRWHQPPRRGGSLRRFSGRAVPLVRLVCVPWCGAGASVYKRLAASLPDHIELLSVQLPGREDRYSEPCLRNMSEIVEHIAADVRPVFDRPMLLFGHSMGALVAHELALYLSVHAGRAPQALIVSGHNAPAWRARTVQWHRAEEDAFVGNLRALGGTPEAVLEDRDMLRAFLPMLRADYEALETYVPGVTPTLPCPVVACAGRTDPEVSADGLQAWQRHSARTVEAQWFDGDHFYLAADPARLAESLTRWCEQYGGLC